MHQPNAWTMIKTRDYYKILATWSGSYLEGESWRLNSGITNCVVDGQYFIFEGFSGSRYRCNRSSYGVVGAWNSASVYKSLGERSDVEILKEDEALKVIRERLYET